MTSATFRRNCGLIALGCLVALLCAWGAMAQTCPQGTRVGTLCLCRDGMRLYPLPGCKPPDPPPPPPGPSPTPVPTPAPTPGPTPTPSEATYRISIPATLWGVDPLGRLLVGGVPFELCKCPGKCAFIYPPPM